MRFSFAVLIAALGSSSAACGGLVVLDLDDGAGGEGDAPTIPVGGAPSTSVPSSNSATTSTGPGNDCQDLALAWETAIDHARACSPLDPVIQCDASVVLLDQCGCASIVVNENHVSEIQEAQAAYDAWVAAGCGPYLCESCSEALGGWCQAREDGGKGRCESQFY